MYYTDHNVLLGSPTGSGKTICAEFAMLKVFRDLPSAKVSSTALSTLSTLLLLFSIYLFINFTSGGLHWASQSTGA